MNVTVTPVDQSVVRSQLRQFRQRKHKDAEREYSQVVERLEQILDENVSGMLDVGDVIRQHGFDEKQRPRLAIARADRKVIGLSVQWRDNAKGFHFDASDNRRRTFASCVEFIPDTALEGASGGRRGFARVPLVPPAIRDNTKGKLSDYHILWEVDRWFDRHPDGFDRDPILLKRIGTTGTLFAVVGQWDLTPLELAILNSIQQPAR